MKDKEKNDIYVTYLNKENVDTATYSLFEQGTLNPQESFIIIENIKNGVYLSSEDEEYNDMTVYCSENEIEEKIKSCTVYDSIHIRFFNVDLDDIKNKYSKIANKENVVLAFFEELETNDYCTTIPMNSEEIMNMNEKDWEKKKDNVIDALNEIIDDSEKEIDFFKADYSFNIRKNKKKISIEFDENRGLYRLKFNSASDLVLEPSEVEDMMNIFEFFIKKSEE